MGWLIAIFHFLYFFIFLNKLTIQTICWRFHPFNLMIEGGLLFIYIFSSSNAYDLVVCSYNFFPLIILVVVSYKL